LNLIKRTPQYDERFGAFFLKNSILGQNLEDMVETRKTKPVALTDKRAMLLYAMFNYELSMNDYILQKKAILRQN
jgi:hypothetical protein